MTSLPAGWKWTTLSELQSNEPGAITDGPFGSNLTSAHYTADGARVVRLQNIGDGVFNEADAFVSMKHFETLKRHHVRPGDLLIASLGDVLPRACLAPATLGPAIVKADCVRVRLADDVEPRWALYALQTPLVRKWASEQRHGVGRLRLGLKVIRSLPVPLPPLDEQRRIIHLLEDHLSRVAAAESFVATAAARTATLHGSWLAAQPAVAKAEQRPLASLLATPLRHGRSVPTADRGFPVLRLTALKGSRIDLAERKVGAWTAQEAAPFVVARGDFLVARGSGSRHLVGRGALVDAEPDPVAYPDTAIKVRVARELITPEYLALVWNSRPVRVQIGVAAKTTAGIHKVNQADLGRVSVPVPNLDLQTALVERAEHFTRSTRALELALGASRAQGSNLRSRLLAAAIFGQLADDNAVNEGRHV